MYESSLSIPQTIPQGIVNNNTLGAYTCGYLLDTITHMPELTNLQRLLMYVRDTYCKGSAAELSRQIEKADTYVNRLFYPIDKRGHKGIGLEIMNACTRKFSLAPGFWETDAAALSVLTISKKDEFTDAGQRINSHGLDAYFGWPFGDRIKPWQYNLLSEYQKNNGIRVATLYGGGPKEVSKTNGSTD